MFQGPTGVQASIGRVLTRNILNPLLFLCATLVLGCMVIASQSEGLVQITAIAISCLVVSVTLYAYLFLLHNEPDRLQSEEYQIVQKSYTLLGDSDHGADFARKVIDNVPVVMNPNLPRGTV